MERIDRNTGKLKTKKDQINHAYNLFRFIKNVIKLLLCMQCGKILNIDSRRPIKKRKKASNDKVKN